MEIVLSFLVAVISAAGFFMMLRRDLLRFIVGFILLSNAVNLMLFAAGRLNGGDSPLIPEGANQLSSEASNPLPMALILTAIVIGFGLLAFSLVLVYRIHQEFGTTNPDELDAAEGRLAANPQGEE